jgi:hypothetical protein
MGVGAMKVATIVLLEEPDLLCIRFIKSKATKLMLLSIIISGKVNKVMCHLKNPTLMIFSIYLSI